jgi:Fusaric acid resistance protein family
VIRDTDDLAAIVTILLAALPVFATIFYLLPLASNFPSMAAALVPLLLASGYIVAQQPLGVLAVVYFEYGSNIDNVMAYDPVNFLNASIAILSGIGIATALFAVFFPETPIRIERRFHRQLIAQLRRTSGVEAPSVQVRESALYERLATTLARLKGEPSAARSCFDGAMIALSTARAIDDLRTATVPDRLPHALAAGVSSLLGRISSAYRYPRRTSLTKCAWEARNLRRRSLAMARAASDAKEIEALAEVFAGCEALRSNLLKSLILIPRTSDVR